MIHICLGFLATAGILVAGFVSFKRGNQKMSQYMMRARVAAQFGTMLAIAGGTFYTQWKNQKTEAVSTSLPIKLEE